VLPLVPPLLFPPLLELLPLELLPLELLPGKLKLTLGGTVNVPLLITASRSAV